MASTDWRRNYSRQPRFYCTYIIHLAYISFLVRPGCTSRTTRPLPYSLPWSPRGLSSPLERRASGLTMDFHLRSLGYEDLGDGCLFSETGVPEQAVPYQYTVLHYNVACSEVR
jgi:hypothetical protein